MKSAVLQLLLIAGFRCDDALCSAGQCIPTANRLLLNITGMTQKSEGRISDSKLILIALVGGMAAFAIALVFISGGAVRQVEIFLPEKTYATVAFQNIDGEVKIVGIAWIAQVNPTIVMRTGDFAMELTVVNQDSVPHALYIDGMDVSTRVLEPGQSEVLTLYSEGEATYNYYIQGNDEPTGQIMAVRVTIYE